MIQMIRRLKSYIITIIMSVITFFILSVSSFTYVVSQTMTVDRSGNRIFIDGEQVFPIGMYHVSWAGDKAELMTALRRVAEGGFNLMHPAIELDDGDFLDLAHSLGVSIIIEPNDDGGIEPMLQAFNDHPAVLGWLVADDFNSAQRRHTPNSILQEATLVNSISPNQLTYMSGTTNRLEQYTDLVDIVGIQTYTVPNDPLFLVDRSLQRTLDVFGTGASIFANLQTWTYEGDRIPTNDEVRNMTYQALVSGVDGILYYTYFDRRWDIEQYPELWEGLTAVVTEVNQLSPMLINGQLTRIGTDYPGVVIGQWVYEESTFIILVNTSEAVVEDVALTVEATMLSSVFEDRSAGFTLADGQLIGNLEPVAVHVYQLTSP